MQVLIIDQASLIARLPALKGYEKQIAWAETIRTEQIPLLLENAQATLDLLRDPEEGSRFARHSAPVREELSQDALKHLEELLLREDASDWIDTRGWFDTQVISDGRFHPSRVRHLPLYRAEHQALRSAK